MPHRKKTTRKKAPARVKRTSDAGAQLAKQLAKLKKTDLIELILKLARADRTTMRELESQFNVTPAPKELIAGTREAIHDATDFDEREINYNFDYDYAAYNTVVRNFKNLIKQGHLSSVLPLALELMKRGSYQVEMSDEGMMADDIEKCLKPVISAVKNSNLSNDAALSWCTEMIKNDRVAFICEEELKELRKHCQDSQ